MPATLVSSTPRAVYAEPGKNYAPSQPLKDMARSGRTLDPNPLTIALQRKCQEFLARDYTSWIEILDIGRQISSLTLGKNLLVRNVRTGRAMTVSKQDGRFSDHKTVSGQFQFYITKLLSEWLSSRPELDPICPSDDDQVEEFIAAVKILQDYYFTRFFNTDYETKEAKSAFEYGTFLTRYRFDADPKVRDIICELLDFPACRWDMRYRAEESPYFIYQSKCSTAKLECLFDADIQSDGEGDDQYSGLRYVDIVSRQHGNTVGNGKDSPYGQYDAVPDENIITEMWLQPEAYCDVEIPISEKTLSGKVIPKGMLLDLFPDGLCAVGINGMRTLIGLYAENHKDHIVSGLYHVQSFSGVGKGVSDAVDAVKELNDLHSQLLAYTKAHSMPAFAYNSQIITEAQARKASHPRGMVAVDFTNAGDGINNVNQAIQALVPGNAAQGAFEMREQLKNDVQIAFQTTQFSNSFPGVDNTTATGAKIGADEASSVLIPQHLNKADHRKRSAVVIYNLFRKYKKDPKWFAAKNLNGITKGRSFNNEIFQNYVDVDFEVVANSQIAESPFQQKENLANLFQYTGGMPGLLQALQMNPDLTGAIIDAFGVKLPIAMKDNVARVCRRRIEECKKILNQELASQQLLSAVGVPIDNTNLAISICDKMTEQISPQELYAPQKATWMADLLDTDELTYGPPQMRLVVQELIRRQLQVNTFGQAERDMDTNLGSVISMLPQVIGEQAMGQQAQQIEQTYQQQQAQAQAQQEQQQQVMQTGAQLVQQNAQAKIDDEKAQTAHRAALAQNAQQHSIAMAQQTDAHAKALELQQNDQQHQMAQAALGHLASIEAAKTAAKNKPKPVQK